MPDELDKKLRLVNQCLKSKFQNSNKDIDTEVQPLPLLEQLVNEKSLMNTSEILDSTNDGSRSGSINLSAEDDSEFPRLQL